MKRRNYHLNEQELAVIVQAMHHDKRPEVREKAHALHLLHLGYGPTAVQRMLEVNRSTIYLWHQAWLDAGLEGLARRPGSGRRFKATPEYERQLVAALESEPSTYGYEFAVWTLDRLRAHLRQSTGIDLTRRTLGKTLQRLDYVYRRPKLDLSHLHDPAVIAAVEANLELLKKKPTEEKSSSSLWMKRPSA